MKYIECKSCEYQDTDRCIVRKTYKGVVLEPDNGCTAGKPKNEDKPEEDNDGVDERRYLQN